MSKALPCCPMTSFSVVEGDRMSYSYFRWHALMFPDQLNLSWRNYHSATFCSIETESSMWLTIVKFTESFHQSSILLLVFALFPKQDETEMSLIFRRFPFFSVTPIPTSISVLVVEKTSVIDFGVGNRPSSNPYINIIDATLEHNSGSWIIGCRSPGVELTCRQRMI